MSSSSKREKISNWLLHNNDNKIDLKMNKKLKFTHQEIELNNKAAKYVQITSQSIAKLDKIENKLGPYECKLCRIVFSNAFELAMHKCAKIHHTLFTCDECNKVFNSSANLGKSYFF